MDIRRILKWQLLKKLKRTYKGKTSRTQERLGIAWNDRAVEKTEEGF